MLRTFGEELKHFALTVDILDEGKFLEIFAMAEDYLKQNLQISRMGLMQQAPFQGSIGLWPRYGDTTFRTFGPYTIQGQNNSPDGLCAFSFDEDKPLWVISKQEDQDLKEAEEYQELWSEVDVKLLLSYKKVHNEACKTLISVPLNHQDNRIGILYFESIHSLKPSVKSRAEFKVISDALAILFLLVDANTVRQNNTVESINNIKNVTRSGSFVNNSLFLAYSEKADRIVTGIIKDVLREFPEINVVDWKEPNNMGQIISEKLIKSIQESKYAICYFSEEVDDPSDNNIYADNPSVLFEAGMIYSLINNSDAIPEQWIPIREELSSDIPFDFAGNKILVIQRSDDKDKSLNRDAFSSDLKEMIKNIVQDE